MFKEKAKLLGQSSAFSTKQRGWISYQTQTFEVPLEGSLALSQFSLGVIPPSRRSVCLSEWKSFKGKILISSC